LSILLFEEKKKFYTIINMRRKNRKLLHLFLALLSGGSLLACILLLSPKYAFELPFFNIPILIIFFILLACFLFFGISFATKSRKHAYLITFFVLVYLLFRLWGLTHPFFFFLLLALFLTLELLFTSKNHS